MIIDSGTILAHPPTGSDCTHDTDCSCLIANAEPSQELAIKWQFKPRQNPKWGQVTREGLVVGRGSNKRVVPPDEVWKLAALGCTNQEMCDWFEIDYSTLKYNFNDYIQKGRAELKHRLRASQLRVALDGNPTMLIWLGKNILGQTDNPVDSETNQPLPWSENDL